jgi:hypothetical protein
VPPLTRFLAHKRLAAFAGALVFSVLAAGCHKNNLTSGYGIGFVTLTAERSDFSSYIVTVDDITLVGKTVGAVTAVAIPEIVDFTKITNVEELWASASIPTDTYTQATITLDYSAANISVPINGVPVEATVHDSTGVVPTTITVTINLDPANQPLIRPTYATTDAIRLAIDFDMALSNTVTINTAAATATVVVTPYVTMATSAQDTKHIRVRGPLVNSSVNVGTFSLFVRPFYDEVNSAGSLSLFNDANTIFTLDGTVYVGSTAGIGAMSQASAGSTMTSTITTFEPTTTPSAVGGTAGKFHSLYVVAGSTLEDFYTDGLEGDVIARSGNTLTLRGTTLFATAAEVVLFTEKPDAVVTVGPSTIVTEDGINATGLTYNSIAVGQHIIARGLYSLSSANVIQLDATGSTATNTGSVRLVPTELFGTVVSSAVGSATLNLQNINEYPASIYNFAGNGATAPTAANFIVDTATATGTQPTLTAADLLWVEGYVSPFGSAPPDFLASMVNDESTMPARMVVTWSGTGSTAPFTSLTATGFVLNLADAKLASAVLRFGAASVNLSALPASPQVVPQTATPPTAAGLPSVFMPLFGTGNTATAVNVVGTWATFQTTLSSLASAPVLKMDARGTYDPATNTFSAATINFVN